MSYGYIAKATSPADVEAALVKARETYLTVLAGADTKPSDAAKEAMDAAAKAAVAIVESGVVGKGGIGVGISGHANPDHKPVTGYANDTVVVTVYSTDTAPAPAPAAAPTAAPPA